MRVKQYRFLNLQWSDNWYENVWHKQLVGFKGVLVCPSIQTNLSGVSFNALLLALCETAKKIIDLNSKMLSLLIHAKIREWIIILTWRQVVYFKS